MSELKDKNNKKIEEHTVQSVAMKMQIDYAKNQAYRPKDLQYVLGDPVKGIGITMNSVCGTKLKL